MESAYFTLTFFKRRKTALSLTFRVFLESQIFPLFKEFFAVVTFAYTCYWHTVDEITIFSKQAVGLWSATVCKIRSVHIHKLFIMLISYYNNAKLYNSRSQSVAFRRLLERFHFILFILQYEFGFWKKHWLTLKEGVICTVLCFLSFCCSVCFCQNPFWLFSAKVLNYAYDLCLFAL